MKTGFYGISDTLDTMMENRIYGKNTVDAVLQDNAVILEEVAFMDFHALALNPSQGPMQQELLDKHYLRKHGPGAYYGQ